MLRVDKNDSIQVRQTQPQRQDPEKELQDYCKAHNCSREEGIKALEKLHGKPPAKKNGNVDMKYHPQKADKPDPEVAYQAVKLQHPEWSDEQIKSYLKSIYGDRPSK